MNYYFSKVVEQDFDSAVTQVIDALKGAGFGVLAQIDVEDTLRRRLNVEVGKYRILGACHPPSALRALTADPHIGLMLPCNVIVRTNESGKTEVAAIDPVASMAAVENEELGKVADEVQAALRGVIEGL